MIDRVESLQALQWRESGAKVAVAVVLKTWGSAPRPVGARLYVREDGTFAGSVSGGCVEKEVIHTALALLRDATAAQTLTFGVADEMAWENGLSCGGEIVILVHQLHDDNAACLREALRLLAKREECVLCIDKTNGTMRLNTRPTHPPAAEGDTFAETLTPPPRLLIIGAGHITQHLLQLAHPLNYDHIVIDPREHWAAEQRFPNTALCVEWPEKVMPEMRINQHDAVCALTHDAKIDDPALILALTQCQPFYIGALGSTRTHKKRCNRLREVGISDADLARIRAPIGLPIGAQDAAEIALSIMAQICAARRGALMQ